MMYAHELTLALPRLHNEHPFIPHMCGIVYERKTCETCQRMRVRPRVWRMESVLRELIIDPRALFGRSRRRGGGEIGEGEGQTMLREHACNGWEQCCNVLQSFGECHDVTWLIRVPAMIRAESLSLSLSPLVRPPLHSERSPVDRCNNASNGCNELNGPIRKVPVRW